MRPVILALLALGLLPAGALARACPEQPTAQAFADVGDLKDYSLLAGGDFAGPGDGGWRLDRATIAGGALRVAAGGSAQSRTFCVGREHPTFRFRARSEGSGPLLVALRIRRGDVFVDALAPADHAALTPTRILALAEALPIRGGKTLQVQLRLSVPAGAAGGWLVDDVHIDPYRVR